MIIERGFIMNGIEIVQLTKEYKDIRALDGVNLTIQPGKIYGLLGRNGAGKSTLLHMIANRIFPTSGEIRLDGESVFENDRVQGRIYCISEMNCYDADDKVYKIWNWVQNCYPGFSMEYANQLAGKFELNTKKKPRQLSTGYNTIFKIVTALATDADYILLDEPILGLDANHRELFYKELLANYAERPKTIIISTHIIEEIADLLEQVVIIKEGKVLLDLPIEEVRKMGYSVTGKKSEVEQYCSGRTLLGEEELGGMKTAYIQGEPGEIPAGLEAAALDLQKLFIRLTNS